MNDLQSFLWIQDCGRAGWLILAAVFISVGGASGPMEFLSHSHKVKTCIHVRL